MWHTYSCMLFIAGREQVEDYCLQAHIRAGTVVISYSFHFKHSFFLVMMSFLQQEVDRKFRALMLSQNAQGDDSKYCICVYHALSTSTYMKDYKWQSKGKGKRRKRASVADLEFDEDELMEEDKDMEDDTWIPDDASLGLHLP